MSGLENVKILFFIKRTKLTRNGEATIFIRITINKERTEFSLKRKVLPKLWCDKTERIKGRTELASELNQFIDQYKKKVLSYIDFMVLDDQEITARIIQERLIGKKEKRRTILKIFQEHNENARKLMGIDFAPDTVQRYETSYMHTKDFIKLQYKREDMALDELNHQFVKNYELYLKTERKCAHNTTIKYLKNFKKIVRIALANNWMKKDPFASIKFKLKQVDAIYLTNEELQQLINKKILIKRIAQVRDVFLFFSSP